MRTGRDVRLITRSRTPLPAKRLKRRWRREPSTITSADQSWAELAILASTPKQLVR